MDKIKAIFLVDGEHDPANVLYSVEELETRDGLEASALYFLGGSEKLKDLSDLTGGGRELVIPNNVLGDFPAVLERLRPQVIVDLSDLPVMGPAMRLRMAASALAAGAIYRGSDFEFRPPLRERVLTKPSCAVIGTGKRCGKTAVSAEMARYLSLGGRRPAVVAMGRGGPAEPYVLQGMEINGEFLLSELEKGLHAASDHYEDAMMAEVTAVGCRRCGGGMAGEPFLTNCVEAARMADGLAVDSVIMEGSGSSVPPVLTDGTVCIISAAQDLEEALGFLGAYRLLISDGVIITMAEEPFASPQKIQRLCEGLKRINGDIVFLNTIFRPHPLKSTRGRKVFLVSTAPEAAGALMEGYLKEKEECYLVGRSHALADRRVLEEDLRSAGDADVLLTELKAAAVDVVTRFARINRKEVVYFHNTPVPVNGGGGLERFFDYIWKRIMER